MNEDEDEDEEQSHRQPLTGASQIQAIAISGNGSFVLRFGRIGGHKRVALGTPVSKKLSVFLTPSVEAGVRTIVTTFQRLAGFADRPSRPFSVLVPPADCQSSLQNWSAARRGYAEGAL